MKGMIRSLECKSVWVWEFRELWSVWVQECMSFGLRKNKMNQGTILIFTIHTVTESKKN